MSEQPEQPLIGWQVLDQDGNVVASGPPVVMEAASETSQDEEEEAPDASD